jgi:hypothetical protein
MLSAKSFASNTTAIAVEQIYIDWIKRYILCALLLLYREVLKPELDLPVDAIRAKRSRYLPTVLTKAIL